MPRIPHAPLELTPPPASPQTAIAPPQDDHTIAPDRPQERRGSAEKAVETAPTLKTVCHAQRVWFELATRTWLRLAALPMELAGCRSVEAVLELQRRHVAAGVKDALAGYAELAALSGDPLPRRAGAAGVTSTGV